MGWSPSTAAITAAGTRILAGARPSHGGKICVLLHHCPRWPPLHCCILCGSAVRGCRCTVTAALLMPVLLMLVQSLHSINRRIPCIQTTTLYRHPHCKSTPKQNVHTIMRGCQQTTTTAAKDPLAIAMSGQSSMQQFRTLNIRFPVPCDRPSLSALSSNSFCRSLPQATVGCAQLFLGLSPYEFKPEPLAGRPPPP